MLLESLTIPLVISVLQRLFQGRIKLAKQEMLPGVLPDSTSGGQEWNICSFYLIPLLSPIFPQCVPEIGSFGRWLLHPRRPWLCHCETPPRTRQNLTFFLPAHLQNQQAVYKESLTGINVCCLKPVCEVLTRALCEALWWAYYMTKFLVNNFADFHDVEGVKISRFCSVVVGVSLQQYLPLWPRTSLFE